jgi:hypothetical protein
MANSGTAFNILDQLQQLQGCLKASLITQEDYNVQKEKLLAVQLESAKYVLQSTPITTSEPLSNLDLSPITPLFSKNTMSKTRTNSIVNSVPVSTGSSPEVVTSISTSNTADIGQNKLNKQEDIIAKEALHRFIDTTPTRGSFVDCNTSFEFIPEVNPKVEILLVDSPEDGCQVAVSPTLDVSVQLNESFSDPSTPLVQLEELTPQQFWSIVLMIDVGEGQYYPDPNTMYEQTRDPFFIPKKLIKSILSDEKANGLESGASVMLKGYHTPVLKTLHVPYCIYKVHRSNGNQMYHKMDICRIDWYCPWKTCAVRKRWFIVDPEQVVKRTRKVTFRSRVNEEKERLCEKLLQMEIPEKSYPVLEVLGGCLQHTHLKGEKGGVRVHIKNTLRECEEIKEHLKTISKTMKRGHLIELFSKQVAPIVRMAQALVNQPPEAFLGGFTDIVPHTLACYQQDNHMMKNKLLEDFNFQSKELLSSKLTKMMNRWVELDCVRRCELSQKIPFDNKKCVVGYIQQLSIYKDDKWAAICFSEAQLLALMVNLKIEPALMWDGTDPNTQVKDKVLMFPLLSRVGYTLPVKSNRKNKGNPKSNPAQVVARLFTNIRDATPHMLMFDLIMEKSKLYSSTSALSFVGIVLLTDMDAIVDAICKKYGLKNWWDIRHVNQAVLRKLAGKICLSIVMSKLSMIRNCDQRSDAESIIAELKLLLTTQQRNGVNNVFFDTEAWEYLHKVVFCDLDKLCKWTVAHLGDSFWHWTQAIESRNNKDLNIWNAHTTQLSVEECLLRYYEIDKAELRTAYLRFLEADLEVLQKTVRSKNKPIKKKFLTSLVRDFTDFRTSDDEDDDDDEDYKEGNKESNQESNKETSDQKPEELIADVAKPVVTTTMMKKQQQLKDMLKAPVEDSSSKIAETKFNKPSKRRKRAKSAPPISEHQENLAKFIVSGDADLIPTVKNADGTKSVADYYVWSRSSLKQMSKEELHKLCSTQTLKVSGTKTEMIDRLLEHKEVLLTQYYAQTVETTTTAVVNMMNPDVTSNVKDDLESDNAKSNATIQNWTKETLTTMTVADLTVLCRQHDVKPAKRKAQIIEVLLDVKKQKMDDTKLFSKLPSVDTTSAPTIGDKILEESQPVLPFDNKELEQAKQRALEEERSQLPLTEEELKSAIQDAKDTSLDLSLLRNLIPPSNCFPEELEATVSTLRKNKTAFFTDTVMNLYATLLNTKFADHKFLSSFIFSGIHMKTTLTEIVASNKSVFSFFNSADIHWNAVHFKQGQIMVYESLRSPLGNSEATLKSILSKLFNHSVNPQWIITGHQASDGYMCGPMELAYVTLLLMDKDPKQVNALKNASTKVLVRNAILEDLQSHCQTGNCTFQLIAVLERLLVPELRRSSRQEVSKTPWTPTS